MVVSGDIFSSGRRGVFLELSKQAEMEGDTKILTGEEIEVGCCEILLELLLIQGRALERGDESMTRVLGRMENVWNERAKGL
jgi:hypothetical protein